MADNNINDNDHRKQNDPTRLALLALYERYQLYAGEYTKPILTNEITIAGYCLRNAAAFVDVLWEERQITRLEITELLAYVLPKIEFLVHKECFHPVSSREDLYKWYNCPYTTSAEMVVLLTEAIRQYDKDNNYA